MNDTHLESRLTRSLAIVMMTLLASPPRRRARDGQARSTRPRAGRQAHRGGRRDLRHASTPRPWPTTISTTPRSPWSPGTTRA